MNTLYEFACRMGDNTLILGHRVSEWCGKAPVIEDDIALANMALDLIGQTQLWLGLAAETEGESRSADDIAYLRDAFDFTNVLLVEQPNGDMAHTLMRQFLFDAWHVRMLDALKTSSHEQVRDIAEKAHKEVLYHVERSSDLVMRLGDGTEESNARMQEALENLWPYAGEMFNDDATDKAVAEAGIAPLPSSLKDGWRGDVERVMAEATLAIPQDDFAHLGGKTGKHTEHLGFILADMQFLQRAYPGATW